MPSIFSDYLLSSGVPGLWVRVVNNTTSLPYVSTAATTAQGLFTFNPGPPGGIYTVYTGLTINGPWIPTGNTSYVIAYTAGDDAALDSISVLTGAPFVPLAGILPGTLGAASLDKGGFAYNLKHPTYGLVGDGSDESAKLIAAYAAIPAGSVVYYPAAAVNYGIGSTITPKANMTHRGAGRFTSTVKRLANMNLKMFGVENLAGQTFEDLGFDLNGTNQGAALIPALRFNSASHYSTVMRCSFINAKDFTIYVNAGPPNQALVPRWRDNEITCTTTANNDIFVPVCKGGYSMGNRITGGTISPGATFNFYESDDHPWIGNEADMSSNAGTTGKGFALSSCVKCPGIGNIAKGNGGTNAGLIGFDILKESDNGANAREQLDATLTGNDIFGFARAYRLHNGFAGIAPIANTHISGGRVEGCNTLVEFNAGTCLGVTVGDVEVVNVARTWLSTVAPQFVKFHDCPGVNPFGKLAAPGVPLTGIDAVNNLFTDAVFYVSANATAIKIGFPPPVIMLISTSPTGGTLAPGTYAYIVSMVDNAGNETLGSTEVSIVVPAGTSTNTVTITWFQWFGAQRGTTQLSYRVYGNTVGGELKMANNISTNTFTDNGSVTPSGALPAANATALSSGLASGTFLVPANQTIQWTGGSAPTWVAWGV